MTRILYEVYIYESGGWRKAHKTFSSYEEALKAVKECEYAPDEYKIIKVEKEI